jgi:hypothetical protein
MEHQSVQADIPRSPERCPLVPISEQSGHRKDPRFGGVMTFVAEI